MPSRKPITPRSHASILSSNQEIEELIFHKNLPLFENLAIADKQIIQRKSSLKQFEIGTYLLQRQKLGAVVYVLVEGCVKIHLEGCNGFGVTLAFRKSSELLGEIGAIDGNHPSAHVLVIEPCTALVMKKQDFVHWMQSMPYFAFNVSQVLVGRIRFATEQINILSTMDSKSRVARQLLALTKWNHDETTGFHSQSKIQGALPHKVTQQVLAEMVGCSRAQVNRDLMQFIREGLLGKCRDKKLIVLDREALKKYCL